MEFWIDPTAIAIGAAMGENRRHMPQQLRINASRCD